MSNFVRFAIMPLDGDLSQGDIFTPIGIALAVLAAGASVYLLLRGDQQV